MINKLQIEETLVEKSNLPIYDATIHWCLSFHKNLDLIDVNENTPCTLLGTVEWHDLNKIVNGIDGPGEFHPQIAAIEEKVVGCHISHLCKPDVSRITCCLICSFLFIQIDSFLKSYLLCCHCVKDLLNSINNSYCYTVLFIILNNTWRYYAE